MAIRQNTTTTQHKKTKPQTVGKSEHHSGIRQNCNSNKRLMSHDP